jgi:hypothetical protein
MAPAVVAAAQALKKKTILIPFSSIDTARKFSVLKLPELGIQINNEPDVHTDLVVPHQRK